jgi:hypothetical protein
MMTGPSLGVKDKDYRSSFETLYPKYGEKGKSLQVLFRSRLHWDKFFFVQKIFFLEGVSLEMYKTETDRWRKIVTGQGSREEAEKSNTGRSQKGEERRLV